METLDPAAQMLERAYFEAEERKIEQIKASIAALFPDLPQGRLDHLYSGRFIASLKRLNLAQSVHDRIGEGRLLAKIAQPVPSSVMMGKDEVILQAGFGWEAYRDNATRLPNIINSSVGVCTLPPMIRELIDEGIHGCIGHLLDYGDYVSGVGWRLPRYFSSEKLVTSKRGAPTKISPIFVAGILGDRGLPQAVIHFVTPRRFDAEVFGLEEPKK